MKKLKTSTIQQKLDKWSSEFLYLVDKIHIVQKRYDNLLLVKNWILNQDSQQFLKLLYLFQDAQKALSIHALPPHHTRRIEFTKLTHIPRDIRIILQFDDYAFNFLMQVCQGKICYDNKEKNTHQLVQTNHKRKQKQRSLLPLPYIHKENIDNRQQNQITIHSIVSSQFWDKITPTSTSTSSPSQYSTQFTLTNPPFDIAKLDNLKALLSQKKFEYEMEAWIKLEQSEYMIKRSIQQKLLVQQQQQHTPLSKRDYSRTWWTKYNNIQSIVYWDVIWSNPNIFSTSENKTNHDFLIHKKLDREILKSIPDDLRAAVWFAKLQGTLKEHFFPIAGLYLSPWNICEIKTKQGILTSIKKDKDFLHLIEEIFSANLGIFTFIPRHTHEVLIEWNGELLNKTTVEKKLQKIKENPQKYGGLALWERRQLYFNSIEDFVFLDEKSKEIPTKILSSWPQPQCINYQQHNNNKKIEKNFLKSAAPNTQNMRKKNLWKIINVIDGNGKFMGLNHIDQSLAHFINEPPIHKSPNVESFLLRHDKYDCVDKIRQRNKISQNFSPLLSQIQKSSNRKVKKTGLWLRTITEIEANQELYHFYNIIDTENPIQSTCNPINMTKYHTSQSWHNHHQHQQQHTSLPNPFTKEIPVPRTLRISIKSSLVQNLLLSNAELQEQFSEWILKRIYSYALDDWEWRTSFSSLPSKMNK